MKKYFLLPLFFLSGCINQQHKVENKKIIEIDSVFENNQKHLDTAMIIHHKSDSVSKEKIVKIIKEIKYLNTEVEKYKEVLKNQTVINEKIIYKIDTVYIETKKNFWGKEKTNTVIKSDSVVAERIDTLKQN